MSDYQGSPSHISNILAAKEKATLVHKQLKLQRIEEYNKNPILCAWCSSPLPYESKKNKRKYCNSSCAASANSTGRTRSDESKHKTSVSCKARLQEMGITPGNFILETNDAGVVRKRDARTKCCTQCGLDFHPMYGRYNGAKFCSTKCRAEYARSPEQRELRRQKALERVENGTHQGWKSRANRAPSYPEQYFINLFTNEGIPFQREVKCGRFFIDFVVGDKIVVEIDGAQHEYPDHKERDRRKDEHLTANGYTVFRIKWHNPTSPDRKELLYVQIEHLKSRL